MSEEATGGTPDAAARNAWPALARETEAKFVGLLREQFYGRTLLHLHKDGPDILARRRDGEPPLALELKVWRWSRKNLNNRINEALANAVRHRRAFPGSVHLAFVAVVLVEPNVGADSPEQLLGSEVRVLSRLLRRGTEDAGFERVVV